jgi:CRP/FNR family transcriptional regulator
MNSNPPRPQQFQVACAACPLRRLPAFVDIQADEIAFIQSFKNAELTLPAGTQVRREGAIGGDYYTLLRGWAFRYRTLSSGARQILNFLLPGDFIGLQEKLTATASHGVELLTESVLCRFPGDRLFDLYKTHPGLGYDVTWLAAHEELIVDENLVSVGQRTAMQRVAMLLIHLYKRADAVGSGRPGLGVEFPVTQRHMADALGLSLVHTHRTLRKLERNGLYSLADGRLTINRPAAMSKVADYYSLPLQGRRLI